MIWIWISLIIALILIEILARNSVTMWYTISAILALILSFFVKDYLIQFLVFFIIGTVLLFTVRDKFLNIIKEKRNKK